MTNSWILTGWHQTPPNGSWIGLLNQAPHVSDFLTQLLTSFKVQDSEFRIHITLQTHLTWPVATCDSLILCNLGSFPSFPVEIHFTSASNHYSWNQHPHNYSIKIYDWLIVEIPHLLQWSTWSEMFGISLTQLTHFRESTCNNHNLQLASQIGHARSNVHVLIGHQEAHLTTHCQLLTGWHWTPAALWYNYLFQFPDSTPGLINLLYTVTSVSASWFHFIWVAAVLGVLFRLHILP